MVKCCCPAGAVSIAFLLLVGISRGVLHGQAQPQPQGRPARDTSTQVERPQGTATISGRVVAATGQPVKRVRIVASPREFWGQYSALTDENGSYEIAELPAGRYTLTASKAGFVTLSYGQRRPQQPGSPVQLGDGEELDWVNFSLPRGSVVASRVLDEDGEPLALASVLVFQYVYRQGQKELVPRGADRSDDRGHYRVFGLEPGEHFVSAQMPRSFTVEGGRGRQGTPPFAAGGGLLGLGRLGGGLRGAGGVDDEPAESVGDAATYYPGVTNLRDAIGITVGVGQEAAGVDFSIQLVPTAQVSGTVLDLDDGGPALGTQVVLVPADGPSTLQGFRLSGRAQPDGTFRVSNVPPGQYLVRARSQAQRGASPLFASDQIAMAGQDVSDLLLMLSRGANVSGSVSFYTTTVAQPTDLTRIRVTAPSLDPVPCGGNSTNARVQGDDTFALSNVAAGARLIRANGLPEEWTLKAVYLARQDVIDTLLDFGGVRDVASVALVFTDRVSELSGIVFDEASAVRTDLTVIAFPTDSSLWRPQTRQIQASRPDQSARYQIRGLPAGDYWLVAVALVQQGEWHDPRFLDRIRTKAERITIREGEITSLNLTIGAPRF